MNLDNLSREIRMVCRACGNDEFEYDDVAGDLSNVPDETELKCTHCSLKTTKGELVEDNSESINAAVDEISEEVVAAVQTELDTVFKKAFR